MSPETSFFDDSSDDDSEKSVASTEEGNSVIKAMRKQIRSLEKQVKDSTPELEELRTFKTEVVTKENTSKARDAFKGVGLNEKQADLFTKLNPDVQPTRDAIATFAAEYGLGELAAPAESSKVEDSGFEPVAGGTIPAAKRFSSDEWNALYKEDPAGAIAVLKAGRVDLKTEI